MCVQVSERRHAIVDRTVECVHGVTTPEEKALQAVATAVEGGHFDELCEKVGTQLPTWTAEEFLRTRCLLGVSTTRLKTLCFRIKKMAHPDQVPDKKWTKITEHRDSYQLPRMEKVQPPPLVVLTPEQFLSRKAIDAPRNLCPTTKNVPSPLIIRNCLCVFVHVPR